MDKKLNNKIWSLVNNVKPGTSKNITWSDAWEVLADWGGIEGGLETNAIGVTTFDIWIGGVKVKTIDITNGWNEKERDWNWNEVFGQALDYIFDNKLIKKPRALRKDAKKQTVRKAVIDATKVAEISKITEQIDSTAAEAEIARNKRDFEAQWYTEKNLEYMKRRLSNLSVKKSDWKKKGKDVTELEKMMDDFRTKIEDIKKHIKK